VSAAATPATSPAARPVRIPRLALRPVASALLALAVVLTATSGRYGYFRDELYFRMLPPRWFYVDQPPLTPLLVRGMSALADEVWAVRVPATVAALGAVLLVALLAREVGGSAVAQGLAAWGYAFAAVPIAFGHTAITAGWDVVAWLAIVLLTVRAVLRSEVWCWIAVGVVAGAATWNKLLVPLLLVSLAVGIAVCGPRRLPWRHLTAGGGLALLIAAPQLAHQVLDGWPQLSMARALRQQSGTANRALLVPFLVILLGPVLVPVWVGGLAALARRPEWRPIRFLAVAFVVALLVTAAASGAPYYLLGLLAAVFAVGCVPAAEWLTAKQGTVRRRAATGAVVANAVVGAVVGLPLIPVEQVGATPVPAANVGVRGSVGWPPYITQVAAASTTLSPSERAAAGIVTTTFGEAGAVDRYGRTLGLPAAASGHNSLADVTAPPAARVPIVVVGSGALAVARRNATCTEVTRLDNRVGVDSDEQGQPVAVCREPTQVWTAVWPQFRHVD
jgi:hypothetical protein